MKCASLEKHYFSIKQAAAYSGLSERLLYEIVAEKEIRHFRIRKKIVLGIEDLEKFIEQRAVEPVDWDKKARELNK